MLWRHGKNGSAPNVGFEVANHWALQLHGGYGLPFSEYGIEKIVRDLRVHQILEGTNEIIAGLIVSRKLIEGAR